MIIERTNPKTDRVDRMPRPFLRPKRYPLEDGKEFFSVVHRFPEGYDIIAPLEAVVFEASPWSQVSIKYLTIDSVSGRQLYIWELPKTFEVVVSLRGVPKNHQLHYTMRSEHFDDGEKMFTRRHAVALGKLLTGLNPVSG